MRGASGQRLQSPVRMNYAVPVRYCLSTAHEMRSVFGMATRTKTQRLVKGAALREAREDAGLSLRALAVKVGSSGKNPDSCRAYLWKIEQGLVTPTSVYIGRIAQALGVSPDVFSERVATTAPAQQDAA